jgi:hypothetical protein
MARLASKLQVRELGTTARDVVDFLTRRAAQAQGPPSRTFTAARTSGEM